MTVQLEEHPREGVELSAMPATLSDTLIFLTCSAVVVAIGAVMITRLEPMGAIVVCIGLFVLLLGYVLEGLRHE